MTVQKAYNNMHVKVAKAMIGWKPNADFSHYNDALILATTFMTSSATFIRCDRLRYLARFFRVVPTICTHWSSLLPRTATHGTL